MTRLPLLSMILLAVLILIGAAGCAPPRAHPPSNVVAGVEDHIDELETAEYRSELAEARARTAVTQEERDAAKYAAEDAKAHRIAAEKALEREKVAEATAAREADDREARADLFRDAILASALVAVALAVAYEFPILRRAAMTIALAGGGFCAFCIELRALLWLVPWVGGGGLLAVGWWLFQHAKVGHAALENLARDAKSAEVNLAGKVQHAVAWLRDHLSWHHASTPAAPLAALPSTSAQG